MRHRVAKNRVWIVVTWDRDVVHAFSLLPGQQFILGQAPNAWPFPEELLGSSSLTVVDFTGNEPRLCFPNSQKLEPGQSAAIEFGRFRVVAKSMNVDGEARTLRRRSVDYRPLAYFSGSAAAFLLFLAVTGYVEPELTDIAPLGFRQSLTRVTVPFAETSAEPELDGPVAAMTEDVFPTIQAIRGWSACGGETDMGTSHAIRVARYAVRGPIDNPDPHISRMGPSAKKQVKSLPDPELIAALEQAPPLDTAAPSAPWGRDSSLGTDEVSARGNMWGDLIDDAPGDDESLGMGHLDGGKVKRIDVVRGATNSANRPARVLHTQLRVEGPLAAFAVEQAMVSSLEKFRDCYRIDRESQGDHEGRVDVHFEVEADGTSHDPETPRVEHVAPATLACVLDQFKGRRFEASSSKSQVTYPLLFIPGAADVPKPIAQLALAPDIPRDNDPIVPCGGSRRRPKLAGQCKR